MDFIHCNSCSHYPKVNASQRRYYMTSCGHIFCDKCIPLSTGTCKTCSAPCSMEEISSNCKVEVRRYFGDPMEVFKTGFHSVFSIISFQLSQAKLLSTLTSKLIQMVNKLKQDCIRVQAENGQLKERVRQAEAEKAVSCKRAEAFEMKYRKLEQIGLGGSQNSTIACRIVPSASPMSDLFSPANNLFTSTPQNGEGTLTQGDFFTPNQRCAIISPQNTILLGRTPRTPALTPSQTPSRNVLQERLAHLRCGRR